MSVELAYQSYGTGPPLVVLHGLFGSARNWQSNARRLAEFMQVFTVDLRNHGASPWVESMLYEDMADDVRAFSARHLSVPPVLLGHSMGGKAAMTLALRHPDNVRALIVADIAPMSYPDRMSGYVAAMQGIDPAAFASRQQLQARLLDAIADAAIAAFLTHNLVRRDNHFDWSFNLPAIAAHLHDIVGFPRALAALRYTGPTLFVYGERSDYVRAADHPAICRLFPNARFVPIADAGHWLHIDQPERLVASVRDFLTRARVL
ncbi:MAG: alpha/beta fold hydrolase [Gammaproteobacteria bacterium]